MAKFCSLFSGSSGNSEYIASGDTGILIDMGRSAKQITDALVQREILPESIKAIFITHGHIDHTKGARVFANRYSVPVYATEATAAELRRCGAVDEKTDLRALHSCVEVGGITVECFSTSHDSPGSCGYVATLPDERRISVCTDLGELTPEVCAAIEGTDLVLIESNHDINMLMNGAYPYPLKMRIAGSHGHLCNEDCDKELVRLVKKGTTRLFLGHLSRENNLPELALQSAVAELSMAGMKKGFDYEITVCPPENHDRVVIF